MSIRVMSEVWEHSKQEGSALLVLLALADFADDDGWCYPSIKRLSTKARLSERATQYALRNLETDGELSVERHAGRGHVNRYKVQSVRRIEEETPQNVHLSEPETVQTAHPKPREKVQIPSEKVQTSAEKVQRVAPRTVIKNRQENRQQVDDVSAPSPSNVSSIALEVAETLKAAPWVGDELETVARKVDESAQKAHWFDLARDGPYLALQFVNCRAYARKPPERWYAAWLNWLKKERNDERTRANATGSTTSIKPRTGPSFDAAVEARQTPAAPG